MIKFKDLKKKSKYSLKKNYVITVFVCLIGLCFLSLYGSTSGVLLNGFECIQNFFDNGHFMTNNMLEYVTVNDVLSNFDYQKLYELTDEQLKELQINEDTIKYIRFLYKYNNQNASLSERLKVKDGIVKNILNFASNDLRVFFDNVETVSIDFITDGFAGYASLTAILSLIAMIIYRLFFTNVLIVGYSRFFLENTIYHNTRVGRVFSYFRRGYFKIVRVMARKTLYQFLWNFTIIGGFIKSYSYRLVPYLVAEDNTLTSKEVIRLSRKLMNGYKWKAFLLDLSFIGWHFLCYITLGFAGLFFVNPYMEGTNAEFYKAIIREKKNEQYYKDHLIDNEYLDKKLYEDIDGTYYPGAKPNKNYYAKIKYKPLNLFALFFVFAFIGWCFEVALFLLKTHSFVNRGTLCGPWLPIYGFGCLMILLIFTKTKMRLYIDNPVLLFIYIAIICGALEYFSSWLLETTVGLKYWDYAGHFLSINGRICLESLCEFGLGGLICIYIFGPQMNKILEKLDKRLLITIVCILSVLFVCDFAYVRFNPRTGYGITDPIIDEYGNVIDANGNIVEQFDLSLERIMPFGK